MFTVQQWKFKKPTWNGKKSEIYYCVVLRFPIENDKRTYFEMKLKQYTPYPHNLCNIKELIFTFVIIPN